MQENELSDDMRDFEALMKNAAAYTSSDKLEDHIMNRIHRFESKKKKSAYYFKIGKILLVIAVILYLLLTSLDKTVFQTGLSGSWLFESICILSFLFLFDKILSARRGLQ